MSRWRVVLYQWECEVEANDEGEALMEADTLFNFMNEARAEEIEAKDQHANHYAHDPDAEEK